MRIHLIVPGGFPRDGENAGIPALQSLARLMADQHDLSVVCLRQYPEPCEYRHGQARVINLGTLPKALRLAEGAVRRARLARFLRGTPPPDVVHAIWIGAPSDLALRHPAPASVPRVVSTFGGELVAFPDLGYGGLLQRSGRVQADRAFARATALTAACDEALARIPQHAGQPHRRIPIYPDNAALLGPRQVPRDPKRVLTVSNINPIKEPEVLLRAFAAVAEEDPDLRLTWCGFDTLGGRAQALAETLGIAQRVEFAGLLRPEELVEHYHRASIYLQASRNEGQGVAVCEAAAAGCAIVATDTGIARDLAQRGAAVVAPTQDPPALAAALRGLLHDAARRARISENAEAWAARHSVHHTAQAFEALYRELLQR